MSRELDELRAKSDVAGRVRMRLRALPAAAPKGPGRSWRPWAFVAVPAVTILVLLLGLRLWRPESASLRAYRGTDESAPLVAGSWVHAEEDHSSLLRFSDDAEVLLEPKASVKIVAIKERTARLALDHGRARVSVVPNRGADYRISAGPFEVHVKGTNFRLGWDPAKDRFELVLYEGRVILSGCSFGTGFAVAAGQEVSASCHDRKLDVKPIAEQSAAAAANDVPSLPAASAWPGEERATPPGSVRPRSPVKPPASSPNIESPRWVDMARHGDRRQAWAQVTSEGVENVIQSAAPMELILLGDTARDVGELALARRVYQLVRSRAPGSHSAAFAAFALGRLGFDDRGAYREAAEWFSAYLKEEPGGDLAREARGRLMEALHRAGSETSARQVATEYLRLHPRGPHAKLAAQLAHPEEPHR